MSVREELVKEELLIAFGKYPNYDDEIPEEMKKVLTHLVENKDWDGLTEFMRIGVNLTRRECIEASTKIILDREADHLKVLVQLDKDITQFALQIKTKESTYKDGYCDGMFKACRFITTSIEQMGAK